MEPKIRFKGFEGEWRKAKLGDIATFSKGSGYSKSDLCKEGSPIVLYGRLYTKYQSIIDEIDTFVAPKANSVISTGGEVIIPASGESPEDISLAATIKNAGVIIGGDLNVLKFDCNNNNPDFMSMAITYSPTRSELSNYSQGKTVVHLRNSEIAKGNVCFPRIEEQKAIVNYVLSLDSQISASTSRLTSLKQMKAASLQAMFPQEGETVPKIRFKGFEGEWTWLKLGDISEQVKRKAPINSTAPVMMISALNGFINQSEKYSDNNAGSSLANYTLLKKGELSYNHGYSKTRNFGSCFNLLVEEARIPFVYHSFRLTNDNDSFYAYYLNSGTKDKDLKRLVSSTARMDGLLNISFKNYMELSVPHPSLAEQQAIANYFTSLDRQISLQSQRLEKLKQIKSACLDKMFV